MCCNSRRKKQTFFYATSPTGLDNNLALPQNSQHSTAQHSTAQHSTAQHSTALAKQAQLATSTNYNSARNIISGYTHFKSDITTFSHRKTAHDVGINYALRMGFLLQVDNFFQPAKRLSQGFKLAVGVRALTRRIF